MVTYVSFDSEGMDLGKGASPVEHDDGDTVANPSDISEVSEQDARAELEKVLGDKRFSCSDRHRAFLRFVSEETLAGRGAAIKAYAIAVDVFGRPASFDAALDPIVRIEATRLRGALARYYDHAPQGSVRIDLPRGRYVPMFLRERRDSGLAGLESLATKAVDNVPVESQPIVPVPVPVPVTSSEIWEGWKYALEASTGLALLILVGVWLLYVGQNGVLPISDRPLVSIQTEGDDDTAGYETVRLQDAFAVALSRFQTVRMTSREVAAQADRAAPVPDFRIALKYRSSPSDRSLWWQVTDVADGEAFQSGELFLDKPPPWDGAYLDETVRELSLRLVGGMGIINSRLLGKEIANPTLGNGCILRSFRALTSTDAGVVADANACLHDTLEAEPSFVDAKALRALLLIKAKPYDEPTPAMRDALRDLREASAIAPGSNNVAYARMTLEFLLGRPDLAISVGRGALQVNPYNGAINARLAQILYFGGNRDEALILAHHSSGIDGMVYRDAELTLALDDYVHGRFADALVHLERAGGETSFGPAMLKVATLGMMDAPGETAAATNVLLGRWPRFHATFRPLMTRLRTDPDLVAAFESGLRKAGIAPD